MSAFVPPDHCAVPELKVPFKRKLVLTLQGSEERTYDLLEKAFYTVGGEGKDIVLLGDKGSDYNVVLFHDKKGATYVHDLGSATPVFNAKREIRKETDTNLEVGTRLSFGQPKDTRTVKAKLVDPKYEAAKAQAQDAVPSQQKSEASSREAASCCKRPLEKDMPQSGSSAAASNRDDEGVLKILQDTEKATMASKAEESGAKRQRTGDAASASSSSQGLDDSQLPLEFSGRQQKQTFAHPGPQRPVKDEKPVQQPSEAASLKLSSSEPPPLFGCAPPPAVQGCEPPPTGLQKPCVSSIQRPAVPQNNHTPSRANERPLQGPAPPPLGLPQRSALPQRSVPSSTRSSTGRTEAVPTPTKNGSNGKCDKCDGPHPTHACPHFKGKRDNHKDAWVNYGKNHPRNLGSDGGNFVLRGARVVRQPGDGSCLFHSLCYGLSVFGERARAETLRRDLACFIQNNPKLEIAGDTIEEWVNWDANTNVRSYASRMMAGRAWGGGIELAACAQLKKTNIHVYERKAGEIRRISCFDSPRPTKNIVHVLYQGGTHYDALVTSSR